jgi:PilZ domain
VTAHTSNIVARSPLVTGLLVRLEAAGVDAGGRVQSIGEQIAVSLLTGLDDFLHLRSGASVAIQFGVGGMLFVGESRLEGWDGLTTARLAHPHFVVHQRRRGERISVRVPVTATVGEHGALQVRGDSIDLSAGGAACVLPGVVLATDASVTLTMLLPDGALIADAVVLEGGRVHRLKFLNMTTADIDRLVSFCQRAEMEQDY